MTQSKRRSTTYFYQVVALTLFGDLHQLVTLSPAKGGLGIPDIRVEAPHQFAASTAITASHVDPITTQSMFMMAGNNSIEELKDNIKH